MILPHLVDSLTLALPWKTAATEQESALFPQVQLPLSEDTPQDYIDHQKLLEHGGNSMLSQQEVQQVLKECATQLSACHEFAAAQQIFSALS